MGCGVAYYAYNVSCECCPEVGGRSVGGCMNARLESWSSCGYDAACVLVVVTDDKVLTVWDA